MAVDFTSLLSRKVDEAKRPPVLPPGTYEGTVVNYQPDEAQLKDGTRVPIVRFNLKLTAPTEDIDPEDLVDRDGKPIEVAGKRIRHDFWLDGQQDFRLSEFISSCGVETEGRSYGETLPECANAPVLVTVTQTQARDKVDKDGNPEMYNNASRLIGLNR